MNSRFTLSVVIVVLFYLYAFFLTVEAKTTDPYKVLEVDKNASQREIQKAFHKLSLQYHPDKNKSKGAQAKFAEINNAYEILSDEEKRKNYDLYGDEKGNPSFGAGYPGDQGGYTYYGNGEQGQNGFNFRPNEWKNMGGQGGSQSFSFSFGGPSSQNSFGFDLNDIFSNVFGGDGGRSHFGDFGGSTRSQSTSQSGHGSFLKSFRSISSKVFEKEISDQGITWLLLSYKPSFRGSHYHESIIQEVADTLQGALKVGRINCDTEKMLCGQLSIKPRLVPRVFVYSYKSSDGGSLVEYNGDLDVRSVKAFCQDHLPRLSKRIDLKNVKSFSGSIEKLPRVLLLSTKQFTPVIWRVLSGLYHKRFIFGDAQVHDETDPMVKRLGVDALPAVVGWLSNGEMHVLKSGISVKDMQTAVHELSNVLDVFEKKNKRAAPTQGRKQDDAGEKQVPLLTGANADALCGEKHAVCIIGAFRSSKAREKLESILFKVSQLPLRQESATSRYRDSISYSLLDANRQQAFLNAINKSGDKSSDKLVLAYKPRKAKFVRFTGEMTAEDVQGFVTAVFNGDVHFTKMHQKPMIK